MLQTTSSLQSGEFTLGRFDLITGANCNREYLNPNRLALLF